MKELGDIKKYYCIDCGKEIWKGSKRCKSCSKKGKNNSNYKNGKCLKKNYCIDCQTEIWCNSIRCSKCNYNYLRGKKRPITSQKLKGHKPPKTAFKKGTKIGARKGVYNNIAMRSGWEIKYAKYLDKQGIKWLYESKTFDLGDTTYTPDFYIPEWDCYIEIKGYWRKDAKKKFKLFKKKYLKVKIEILNKTKLQKLKIL